MRVVALEVWSELLPSQEMFDCVRNADGLWLFQCGAESIQEIKPFPDGDAMIPLSA